MAGGKKAIVIGMDALIFPIVKKFIKEGILPNFARLIKEGSSGEALPCLPPWTPTNWAVIATGSNTGTNDCFLWSNHRPDDTEDAPAKFSFDSTAVTAEFIWEAAERAGRKTLCASYPGAWPPRVKNGYVITPLDRGVTSHSLVPGGEYRDKATRPGAGVLTFKEAVGWKGVTGKALEAEMKVGAGATPLAMGWAQIVDGKEVKNLQQRAVIPGTFGVSAVEGITLNVLMQDSAGKGYDHILICQERDATKPLASIGVGEWSKWSFIKFPFKGGEQEGVCRFKLLTLNPDGTDLRLLRSEVYPTTNWTYPESLGKELIKEIGPWFEWPSIGIRAAFGGIAFGGGQASDRILLETNLEELRYQALWLPKAAGYIKKKYGWDLYYQHWHLPDILAHSFLSKVDPASPFFGADAEQYWDIFRYGYRFGDEMLGEFMKMADKNTYVIVVSDHGATPDYAGVTDTYKLLVDNGFLTLKDPLNMEIDWEKTTAYPHGLIHIEINLKGRNPQGIVPPGDYEKMQEKIIDALYCWKDEQGRHPILFAMKKRDAQMVGYWGPTTGDVVCCYNGGYSIGFLGDRSIGPPRDYAEHWCKPGTDRTTVSSNMASFMMKGPGIKAGYERDPERLGFMHLVDVVPTVSHLMGFRPPAQSQGSVLWDMIE